MNALRSRIVVDVGTDYRVPDRVSISVARRWQWVEIGAVRSLHQWRDPAELEVDACFVVHVFDQPAGSCTWVETLRLHPVREIEP